MTLVGACPQNLTSISFPFKRDPVPHRLALFLQIILTDGHEVGAIYYCLGDRVGKSNRWLLALLNFPLLVAILPAKSPCTLTIIARDAPLVLLVVVGHGGCYHIFGIWVNRLSSYPFWKLIYWLLGFVNTRSMSRWPAVFLDMALFIALVTNYIWPGRWPSSRSTTISTAAALEINLLLVNNVAVFSQIFLSKETIGNDIISLHNVFVTQ